MVSSVEAVFQIVKQELSASVVCPESYEVTLTLLYHGRILTVFNYFTGTLSRKFALKCTDVNFSPRLQWRILSSPPYPFLFPSFSFLALLFFLPFSSFRLK